jgi:biopolymer transport protein ExbD
MAKKRRLPGGGGTGEVNMTPMIDCTFQLIIFFILTAQMAQEQTKVAIHKPHDTQAIIGDKGEKVFDRVTVNIYNRYGDNQDNRDPVVAARPDGYNIAGKKVAVGDSETLELIFRRYRNTYLSKPGSKAENFFVEIRSDMDIAYGAVEPVMLAAAKAEISKMAITAIAEKKKQKQLAGDQ